MERGRKVGVIWLQRSKYGHPYYVMLVYTFRLAFIIVATFLCCFLRYWLRTSITLSLVMGINWLVGLLAFIEELTVIAYIGTIFVAAQGSVLFIVLVSLSKQVCKGQYYSFSSSKLSTFGTFR